MRSMGMLVAVLVASAIAACSQEARPGGGTGPPVAPGDDGSLFREDFESGTLAAWTDGVDPSRHRIITDPASAASGSSYLAVTYPAGSDGGWLTHFLMPGYDSLYVSFSVRFPGDWRGGTKLVALYGSRIDDQWSAFGKAGLCPDGTDFFAAMLLTELGGNPGPVRFYTYYPAMAREPDGVTCWGRYGTGSNPAASYGPSLELSRSAWHRVAFWVQLNAPAQANGRQEFWIDGVPTAVWSGLSFRDTPVLRLNAVQLSFSVSGGGVPRTQELYVDDLRVRSAPP